MAEDLSVLYVIDSLAPGGAETSLASMAPYLSQLGVQLHVATLHDRRGVQPALRRAGAQLHSVDGGRARRVWTLRRLVEEVDPDLVHTTLFESDQAGRVAARLSGRPVVTSYVSTGFELGSWRSLGGIRSRGAASIDAATARLVTSFHAVSEPVAAVMARRTHLPRSRFTVIPRGRDPVVLGRRSADRRSRVRSSLGIDDHQPVVLHVGRQVPPKNHVALLHAVPAIRRSFPSAQILLAGTPGASTPSIERTIDELELDAFVHDLGHRADVADLMVAADVLALPSLREGFPGTLVEALALECPIVASDIPAVRAVTGTKTEGVARLVSTSDPAHLAAAIVDTLRVRPEEQIAKGRVRFETQFTTAAVTQDIRRWYGAVVDGRCSE